MGKATLILILGSIALFTVYSSTMNNHVWWGTKAMVDRYSEIQAKQAANSLVNIILTDLAEDAAYRNTNGTANLFEVDLNYRVVDTILLNTDSLIMIDVDATYNDMNYSVTAFSAQLGGWVPPFIRGAWTADDDLNNTISDMYIDGRDYNLDGSINPGNGKPAVSSGDVFTNVDNAEIGGTYLGVDYPTTSDKNIWENLVEQHVDWGGTFPTTPDEILGYPEGTLIDIAKSGEGGSQYVLNPPEVKIGKKKFMGGLTYPLSGVTYMEVTNGKEYEFIFEQNNNKGIVIVHSPAADSRLKGVKYNPDNSDGIFTGLLVTDYSFHHHISIVGAVLQLSDELEDSKNCNGNKDHFVHYSSEAIIEATKFVADESGETGNNTGDGSGFGKGRKRVVLWYE